MAVLRGRSASPGALMKRLREERGMTLAELARLTRKTKGYLSKLERSRKLPPFTTLSTIAQALGADLDLFLAGQIPQRAMTRRPLGKGSPPASQRVRPPRAFAISTSTATTRGSGPSCGATAMRICLWSRSIAASTCRPF